ncbi:MAG TPA: phosphatase PAP2 family protein [Chitinispirillaceae bacterium]|nr:phosphatase PAP2 family protein [Chitinispirillaceae bacterium]
MIDQILSIDKSLFLFLNAAFANGFFDLFFSTITEAKFWIIPGSAAVILLAVKERKKALIIIGLSILTVAITDPVSARLMKPFFARLRPCNPKALVEGGRFLLGYKRSFSFPSSHSMNIFAQATLFSLFYPRLKLVFIIFAAMIGYSRIYVGVHYPLDVIVGALTGSAIALTVYYSYYVICQKKPWKREPVNDPIQS